MAPKISTRVSVDQFSIEISESNQGKPWNSVVGEPGFEPGTSSPPDWRAARLRHSPKS